ncbi:MAG: hypothetical protein COC06_10255 [Bacteroidales bacterium]|nr:MAG: hypothetical protein COC06_10255 [Bacteroidales bacterium]
MSNIINRTQYITLIDDTSYKLGIHKLTYMKRILIILLVLMSINATAQDFLNYFKTPDPQKTLKEVTLGRESDKSNTSDATLGGIKGRLYIHRTLDKKVVHMAFRACMDTESEKFKELFNRIETNFDIKLSQDPHDHSIYSTIRNGVKYCIEKEPFVNMGFGTSPEALYFTMYDIEAWRIDKKQRDQEEEENKANDF